jgi:hypothetical protein
MLASIQNWQVFCTNQNDTAGAKLLGPCAVKITLQRLWMGCGADSGDDAGNNWMQFNEILVYECDVSTGLRHKIQ